MSIWKTRKLSGGGLRALPLVAVSALSLSAALAQSNRWEKLLTNGTPVIAHLDQCSGSIGTLACGSKYEVVYLNPTCERVTGYHVRQRKVITFQGYCNGRPGAGTISLWGAKFTFKPDGSLYSNQTNTLVGTLKRR